MFQFTTLPPLSLYIHFPWCVRKCPYCDFNSHELKKDLPEQQYIDALLTDLDQELPAIWGRPITSIFMGGGTPSLFSPEAIDKLISGIRARLNINNDIEITMEANPGTAEQSKFNEFYSAGINRLSIGIQSFNDDHLQKLGRIHNRTEAIKAAEIAHDAGFNNFNLDLMFALPEQTLKQAIEDIHNAIDLEPSHISHYQLTIEPNTFFHHHPPVTPDDETSWQIQEQCQAILAEHGYMQYEVSAYAKNKQQCQHNLNYWQFGDYLGIGAGAHDKITHPHQQQIERKWKTKQPQQYLEDISAGNAIQGQRTLSRTDAGLEFMMNALRLTDGFDSSLFAQHSGLAINTIEKPLRLAEEKGWLEWQTHWILPTEKGKQYLNDLVALFLPE